MTQDWLHLQEIERNTVIQYPINECYYMNTVYAGLSDKPFFYLVKNKPIELVYLNTAIQ